MYPGMSRKDLENFHKKKMYLGIRPWIDRLAFDVNHVKGKSVNPNMSHLEIMSHDF